MFEWCIWADHACWDSVSCDVAGIPTHVVRPQMPINHLVFSSIVLTTPLIVPDANRSPGRILHPVIVW